MQSLQHAWRQPNAKPFGECETGARAQDEADREIAQEVAAAHRGGGAR